MNRKIDSDADNLSSDIQPFKKIQNKIKKEKREKIFRIVCLSVWMAVFLVLGFFQVYSNLDGPNYDKIIYTVKAKNIAKKLVAGDTDILLDGVNRTADFMIRNNHTLRAQGKSRDFYDAMSNQLKELYPSAFENDICKVKTAGSHYVCSDSFSGFIEEDAAHGSKAGTYYVDLQLASETRTYDLTVTFFSKNAFIIHLNNCSPGVPFEVDENVFFAYYDYYASALTGLYEANAVYYLEKLLLDRNPADDEIVFRFVFEMFVRDCHAPVSYEKMNDAEKIRYDQAGNESEFCYDDIIECTDYYHQLLTNLSSVYHLSETVSIRMDMDKYDPEQHLFVKTLFWEMKDANGKKGVMIKDFYSGPYGFEAIDESETIYHEDGFDEELIRELAELFD